MGRPRNPDPIKVFEEIISDAKSLLDIAEMLKNQRKRCLRTELREKLGETLRINKKRWDDLDGLESSHAFIALLPDGGLTRDKVLHARGPILRQAIVAVSAAIEAYICSKAIGFISEAMAKPEWPARMAAIQVPLGEIKQICDTYQRQGWGHRAIIEDFIARESSPAPSKIGQVFSAVGRRLDWKAIDIQRQKAKGTSEEQLEQLYERRNQIAHRGDRKGSGRAQIDETDVKHHIDNAESIVKAIEIVASR